MALFNRAYLVISSPQIGSGDGVFECYHDLEPDDRVEKSYLVGNAGTQIQEAIRFITSEIEDLPDPDLGSRRKGLSVDAGGGQHTGTLTFTAGVEDLQWGDGSGGTGPSNVTKTDASGEDVNPRTRLDILQYWIANTLTDSRGRARLHIGEWTDGSVGNASAGVYGTPFPVDILACEPRSPVEEPSNIQITLEYRRTQVPDAVVEDLAEWIDNAQNSEEYVSGNASDTYPDA